MLTCFFSFLITECEWGEKSKVHVKGAEFDEYTVGIQVILLY